MAKTHSCRCATLPYPTARLEVAEHLGGGRLEEELHGKLQRVVHGVQRGGHRQQPVVPRARRKRGRAPVQRRAWAPGTLRADRA